ncbi:uncharacterized protein LOC128862313 [Anastrepha ludens]|uniref:uncharacterized protein LOC128862313 n=1 Tax=Anastrepha ludens TaxID=28586 RepID=UPI0023AE8D66|nr:uncharacterized protein LOC128862313 [Anastrepha ludens]
MFKPAIGLLLLAALCVAEVPTRLRSAARRPSGARVRFLARQQAAPAPAPTGYPAAGVTPEIPFDLPSSTVKPEVTYLPPDNTYGPPPQPAATYGPPVPHSTYGPPTEAPASPGVPDATYGPPDNTYLPPVESATEEEATVEEQQPTVPQSDVVDQPQNEVEAPAEEEDILVAVADDGSVIAVSNSFDAPDSEAEQPARLVFQRFPQGKRHTPADAPIPARLVKLRRAMPAKVQPQPQSFLFASRYTTW